MIKILLAFTVLIGLGIFGAPAISENRTGDRKRRFGPMGGGAGGSPFHSPGGMGGGSMGGMNPMRGPMTPGMGRANMGGGAGMGHGAASLFSGSGFSCIRGNLVCPQWCLVEDENGCKSCPCGPAGGMSALAGGPSGNPISMVMSAMGGAGGGHMMGGGAGGGPMMGGGPGGGAVATAGGFSGSHGSTGTHTANQCVGTKLCMEGCSGQYELGPVGADGCQSCSCKTGGSSVSSVAVSTHGSSGHCTECTEPRPVTNTQVVYVQPAVTVTKPVKECTATLLCASTCQSGYQLGTTVGGCRSCTCPAKHQVSTTTIHYITQLVAPARKECTHTAHCMSTCESGYHMSTTDTHGCPMCSCVQVQRPYQYPIEIAVEPPPRETPSLTVTKPYQYPIEIAVEPPPYETPQTSVTLSLMCSSALTCNTACSVGYKCGTDRCPTCECIHPAVVGLTSIQHVHVERPVMCRTALTCPASCSLGYRCGPDGCPTCECLVAVTTVQQVRPQYTAQTCTHTLTCAATCSHGYELVTDGTGGCSKCVCKQVQAVYEPNVYAVQRPQPQYAVLQCPSTDSCSAQCPHGHEIVRQDGKCPECRCVQSSQIHSLNGGSSSPGTGQSGGGSSLAIGHSGGSGLSMYGSSPSVAGQSGGGGSLRMGHSGGSGLSMYGSSSSVTGPDYCPPIPQDCQPSCIKYDVPHCRRCECTIQYPQFQGLLRGKKSIKGNSVDK